MNTRKFALIIGVLYLALGIFGFIPNLLAAPDPNYDLKLATGYGDIFGFLPTNILHNIVHLIVGAWGIASYKTYNNARGYSQAMTILYAVIAIAGLIPGLNTMFGYMPIYGNNVWLNGLVAMLSAYFGFAHIEDVEHAEGHNMRRGLV